MKKTIINHKDKGFEGILYSNDTYDKIIIAFGGNEGGIKNAKRISKLYSKYNIPSISIAYFKYKNTSKYLCDVPLEYLINVIDYVKSLGYKKVGLDAFSKGTELALNVASRVPVDFLILRAPSYFNSEGTLFNNMASDKCCWSYENNNLAFTKYPRIKYNFILDFLKHREYHILKFHDESNINKESIIDTSSIKCPTLLFSSKIDTVWPSYKQAIYLNDTLSNSKHISYDYLSHFLLPSKSLKQMCAYKSERHKFKKVRKERESLNEAAIEFVKSI